MTRYHYDEKDKYKGYSSKGGPAVGCGSGCVGLIWSVKSEAILLKKI